MSNTHPFPWILDDPQYAQFRNFLLDKTRTSEQKTISVTIEELANITYLPIEKLKEIEVLLKEKRQIIFYGPPGTGKTFIAIQAYLPIRIMHCSKARKEH